MKPRTAWHGAIGLVLLLLSASFGCSARHPQQTPVRAATINADCAPWDGSAFTVSIPHGTAGSIDISIWQAPNMERPTDFSFPDPTGRVGNAVYRTAFGDYQVLRGTVWFGRVKTGHSVEGRFALTSESGLQFNGQFEAMWGKTAAFCG